MFSGSMVALATPMYENGDLDLDSLRTLVDWHIDSGTTALIAGGTTGESGGLTAKERIQVIRTVVKQSNNRVPVIAGVAAVSTQAAIEQVQAAMAEGVDACLIMAPAYIKPTQEGLYQHYKSIAEAAALPQILYNVPSRTACDILPETVIRLANIPNIVGIKEASGDLARVSQIVEGSQGKIDVYSGEDNIALDVVLAGGRGVISVTANVAPQLMQQMMAAGLSNDVRKATAINERLADLHKELFIESNPIPTKWALHEMKKISSGIRLPLTVLSEPCHKPVRAALIKAGVL